MEMGYMIAEWLGWGDGSTSLAGRMGPLFDLSTLSILSVFEIENVQATAPITIGSMNVMQHIMFCLLIPAE